MPEPGQSNFGKQPRGDLRRQRDEALADVERLMGLLQLVDEIACIGTPGEIRDVARQRFAPDKST